MKRRLCLMLATILALTTIPALAATVPSKTTNDLTLVAEKIETSTGFPLAEDFAVALPETVSETAEKQLQALIDFATAEPESPVLDYFVQADDTETREAIAGMFPEDTDVSAFVVNEFAIVTVDNYAEAYGDVTIPFTFATPYEDGTLVFVMAGFATIDEEGNEEIVWMPLAAEVVDGEMLIHFTQDFLSVAGDKEIMLAVFSQPAQTTTE